MKSVEVLVCELSGYECKNCWWRYFFLLIIEGDIHRHFFLCYENYDKLYGNYQYYQYYFN